MKFNVNNKVLIRLNPRKETGSYYSAALRTQTGVYIELEELPKGTVYVILKTTNKNSLLETTGYTHNDCSWVENHHLISINVKPLSTKGLL